MLQIPSGPDAADSLQGRCCMMLILLEHTACLCNFGTKPCQQMELSQLRKLYTSYLQLSHTDLYHKACRCCGVVLYQARCLANKYYSLHCQLPHMSLAGTASKKNDFHQAFYLGCT